jgi:hypothetical protein
MKASLILRIALALVLLELAGHTWLILSFVPKHGLEEAAVIAAMKSREFSFGGSYRTYWDLYFGYELFVSLSLIVEAGVLWQVMRLANAATPGIRTITGVLAGGEICYAILMGRYFFIIPIAGHTTMAMLLAAAWLRIPAGRPSNPGPSSPSAVRPRESLAR